MDDNPATRKVVRLTLESAGYDVLEAPDGATTLAVVSERWPHLILQDLHLPDIYGTALVQRLRALPGGRDIPILAFSGYLPTGEQAQTLKEDFTDYLFKPILPSRLLEIVASYLPRRAAVAAGTGGRRVLLVDDDPVQLKLQRLQLEQAGYEVTTAADGEEALAEAEREAPDAIVSDVLMPRLDGFRLCQAVRQHPRLGRVPVVLVSTAFTEEGDRRLAREVGANALVARTPDLQEMREALEAALQQGPPSVSPTAAARAEERYPERILHQLERQAALNVAFAQRLAEQQAALATLAELTSALKGRVSLPTLVHELLYRGVEAVGGSRGLAYLKDADGQLVLAAAFGCEDAPATALANFFGHTPLLQEALDVGEPVALPSTGEPTAAERDLLARAGGRSLLLLPLAVGAEQLGVLVFAAASRVLAEDLIPFARAFGYQAGQAVELVRLVSQLRQSEERLARIVETVPAGIVVLGLDREFIFANPMAEEIMGLARATAPGRRFSEPVWQATTVEGTPIAPGETLLARVTRTGQPLFDEERGLERPDGSRIIVSVNVAPLKDEHGAPEGMIIAFRDVTTRKESEAERARLHEALAEREQRLQELVSRLLVAQEEEQRRIAYEIHDGLAQTAAGAQMYLENYAAAHRPRSPAARQQLERAVDLARRTSQEARQVIGGLRPPVLDDFGLVPALRLQVEALQAEGWEAEYEAAVGAERLPAAIETVLFRVTQEALSNVRKHAGPTRVQVSLKRRGREVRLEVRDWGRGFRRSRETTGGGIGARVGLHSMEERVRLVGGTCRVQSRPGAGTRVVVGVPLPTSREGGPG